MATAKEREEFIGRFAQEFGSHGLAAIDAARQLLRLAKTHGRLAVETCNGHPMQSQSPPAGYVMAAYNARVNKLQDAWDARIEKQERACERRITEILTPFGLTPCFGGDPRGYTVKIHFPSESFNTWGGKESGWGIPQ